MTGTSGGGGLGEGIRNVVGKVHGTGEAIRGKALAALDDVSGDRTAAAKNEAIANKGIDEFQHGYQGKFRDQDVNAGATPTNAHVERLNTTQSTSTNYGPHSTNVGNKLDPRFDSDVDHRGAATTSTNVGPHSTNIGNKLDPRIDSDADHRANPLSSVSGTGTGAGSTNVGPHSTNIGNKIDPRFDSDADHRTNPESIVGGQGYTTREQHQPVQWPQHEHRGSVGSASGLEAAHKVDPLYETGGESMHYTGLTNIHQHRGSIGGTSGLHPAEKLDPPETARSPGYTQSESFNYQPKVAQQQQQQHNAIRGVLDIDTEINSSESDEAAGNRSGTHTRPQYDDRYQKKKVLPDTYEKAMFVEPEYATRRSSYSTHLPTASDKRPQHRRAVSGPKHETRHWGSGPGSGSGSSSKGKDAAASTRGAATTVGTATEHKSGFLNLLDPRVDWAAVRRERKRRGVRVSVSASASLSEEGGF